MTNIKMAPQEIFQYLNSQDYNLTSDTIFKQPDNKTGQTIWDIYVFLTQYLHTDEIENIQASLTYLIDPEKHFKSSRWVKQHIVISKAFKKLSLPYRLLDIFKCQRDKILPIISRLIQAHRYISCAHKEYDETILKHKMLLQQRQKSKIRNKELKNQYQDLKKKKKDELPLYEDSIKLQQSLTEQLSYKKQEKMDLINSQRQLQQELNRLIKKKQQTKFQNEEKKLKIASLKKQIVKNLPEIKTKRISLEEEYNIIKADAEKAEAIMEAKIKNALQKKNTIKTELWKSIQKWNKIVENLKKQDSFSVENQQLQLQRQHLLKNNQESAHAISSNENLQFNLQQQIKEARQKLMILKNQIKNKQAKSIQLGSVEQKKIDDELNQMNRVSSQLRNICQSLQLKIQNTRSLYKVNYQKIQREYQMKKQQYETFITKAHQIFHKN